MGFLPACTPAERRSPKGRCLRGPARIVKGVQAAEAPAGTALACHAMGVGEEVRVPRESAGAFEGGLCACWICLTFTPCDKPSRPRVSPRDLRSPSLFLRPTSPQLGTWGRPTLEKRTGASVHRPWMLGSTGGFTRQTRKLSRKAARTT